MFDLANSFDFLKKFDEPRVKISSQTSCYSFLGNHLVDGDRCQRPWKVFRCRDAFMIQEG